MSPRLSFQLTGARPRGSALLIALWAIAMLSVTILGVVEYVQNDCEEVLSMKRDLRALQLANSGVAVALNPQVKRGDAILSQRMGPGESFVVHLRSEGRG